MLKHVIAHNVHFLDDLSDVLDDWGEYGRHSETALPSGQIGGICHDVEEEGRNSDSGNSDYWQGRLLIFYDFKGDAAF